MLPARLPPGHPLSRAAGYADARHRHGGRPLEEGGPDPEPEIMILLVSVLPELEKAARGECEAVIAEVWVRQRAWRAEHPHRYR